MANSEKYNIDLVGVTSVAIAKPQADMGMGQKGSPGKDAKGGMKGGKGGKFGDKGKAKGRTVTPVRGGGSSGKGKSKGGG